MSIQTELTRITNAKAAIKAAVEGKGVTVPDGTLLDGMAALIESIEAGVGGGGNIVAGTYTPASTQTNRVTVTHNLGKEPTGVLFAKYHYDINTGADTVLFLWQSGNVGIRYFVYSGSTIVISRLSVSGANTQVHAQNHLNSDIVCGLTETTFQTPKNLYAGTYIWVVFGEVLK